MSLWGQALGVSYAQVTHSPESLLLPMDQDVKLPAPSPAPCLRGHCCASHHDDTVLNI